MPSKNTTEFISPLFGNLAKPSVTLLEKWTLAGDDYNRASEKPLIAAQNDLEAALVFLNEFRDSPATLRVYAKELERLFLWCKIGHGSKKGNFTEQKMSENASVYAKLSLENCSLTIRFYAAAENRLKPSISNQ